MAGEVLPLSARAQTPTGTDDCHLPLSGFEPRAQKPASRMRPCDHSGCNADASYAIRHNIAAFACRVGCGAFKYIISASAQEALFIVRWAGSGFPAPAAMVARSGSGANACTSVLHKFSFVLAHTGCAVSGAADSAYCLFFGYTQRLVDKRRQLIKHWATARRSRRRRRRRLRFTAVNRPQACRAADF